jgi:hypothetical protein
MNTSFDNPLRNHVSFLKIGVKVALSRVILLLICVICASLIQDNNPAVAQATEWVEPQPINSCCAFWPVPITDPWGNLHLLWTDEEFINYTTLQQDDLIWSVPIEILASVEREAISRLDAALDLEGNLHVVWIESVSFGSLYYSYAPIWDAGDARAWSKPELLADRAFGASIAVDSDNALHVVYTPFNAGVAFAHIQTDENQIWSESTEVLAAELGGGWAGGIHINMAIDQQDTLHVVWNSTVYPEGFPPHQVYYQNLAKGNQNWGELYVPDPLPPKVAADRVSAFKNVHPNIAVSPSGTIHITWHQYTGLRRHTYSIDAGQSWRSPTTIYPNLGAAYNGIVDMAFDAAGNMHTIAPRGGVWTQTWFPATGWTPPELVDSRTPDWHHQRIAIVQGNVVYLFYTDVNETGIIWYTYKELTNIPQLPLAPTLTPTSPPTPTPVVLQDATPTPNLSPQVVTASVSSDIPVTESSVLRAVFLGAGLAGFLVMVVSAITIKRQKR